MKKVVWIVVILAIVAGGGYWAVKSLFPQTEEITGPVYATQPITRGNIEVGVDIIGNINASWAGSIQVPGGYSMPAEGVPASYIVADVYVKVGDYVNAGQPIARLAAPSMSSQIEALQDQLKSERESLARMLDIPVSQLDSVDVSRGLTIQTEIGGRLTEIIPRVGEEVTAGSIVAKVVDDSHFQLTAKLVSTEIEDLKDNYKAVLRFPGQYSSTYNLEAKIIDINRNSIPEKKSDLVANRDAAMGDNGDSYEFVHWVTLQAENPGLIRTGMIAEVGFYDPQSFSSIEEAVKSSDRKKMFWALYLSTVEKYVDEEEILSRVTGVITKIEAKLMSLVKPKDVIMTMSGQDVMKEIDDKIAAIRKTRAELMQLQSQESTLTILAPSDGIIADFNKTPGGTCQPGEWLGSVFSSSDMNMWSRVDDTDVVLVKQGASAIVTFDALPGQIFDGTVDQVSNVGFTENGVTLFDVYIRVEGNAEVKSGMSAKARVGAGSVEDVLLVPLEAVFRENEQNMVEILDPDGTVRTAILELGLMNNRVAEVISGLQEGDLVITGSSGDILPSQSSGSGGGGILPIR